MIKSVNEISDFNHSAPYIGNRGSDRSFGVPTIQHIVMSCFMKSWFTIFMYMLVQDFQ